MNRDALCARVEHHLGQRHRYEHCVRVAAFAEDLARTHGLDAERAWVAGMLHDLARLYSPQRLVSECRARNIDIDDYAREHPVVLHAPLSADLAAELFGVSDADIRSAICKHTLAAPRMSPLDHVLYLADSLEPARAFDERAKLAELARRNLFEATRATIESSLRYLSRSGTPPAPQTLAALETLRAGVPASSEVATGRHR